LKKKKTLSIKICPKCEKPSLYRAQNLGWTISEMYRCSECDYEGAFYLEIEPNENGENFADLEKLKKLYPYPNDIDNSTEIEIDEKTLNEPVNLDKD